MDGISYIMSQRFLDSKGEYVRQSNLTPGAYDYLDRFAKQTGIDDDEEIVYVVKRPAQKSQTKKRAQVRILDSDNFKQAISEIEIIDEDGIDEIMAKLRRKGWIEKSSEASKMPSAIDYGNFVQNEEDE